MLISLTDCIALGILHENYPNPLPGETPPAKVLAKTGKVSVDQSGESGPSWPVFKDLPIQPTPDETVTIKNKIMESFADVFDQSNGLRCMDGPAMSIELKMGAEPFYVNGARPIAFADRPEVKRMLDEMVDGGIIAPISEPSDWAAPLVVIRKPDGSLRLCVDFTRLNRFVKRPTHPVRTPRDAVAEIDSEATFYSCFDAACGYFQVPLDEASQHLTVFMTPWGRYKFLRASMGLSCSSDEFNRRADNAFLKLTNTVRVVDDLLRFDREFSEHVNGVCTVLQAAREAGITLSTKKIYIRPKTD